MKLKNVNWKETAMQLAGTFVGIAGASWIKKGLQENETVSGLAGNAKNYLVPGVLTVAGAVMSASVNDKFLKSAGFGMTAVGGASILNEVTGKNIVTISGVNGVGSVRRAIPSQRRMMRGIGNVTTTYPGMGNQPSSLMPGMGASVKATF